MRTATQIPKVRPAAVAGSFYPRDPGRLRAEVGELLAGASGHSGVLKAVIAPHAGYVYSGRAGAAALCALAGPGDSIGGRGRLGAAPDVRLRGVAAPSGGALESAPRSVPRDPGA